jgi:hypothetical protein
MRQAVVALSDDVQVYERLSATDLETLSTLQPFGEEDFLSLSF